MGKLSFTVSPTRSGKSTYAQIWKKEEDSNGLQRLVVNSDDIRLAIHGQRYNKHTEPIVFGIEQIMLKALLRQDLHILFDETNTSEVSIRKILAIDPNAQPIYIPSTREQCKERALATGQNDLVEKGVIDRHFDNLEKLIDKYAWNIHDMKNGVKILSQYYVQKMVDVLRKDYQ